MWLFDSRGFVSVVAYDPKKDRNKKSKFPTIARQKGTHVLIRARIKEDLDMLKTVVPTLHIETDKAADYSFRCVMTRRQYKKFLTRAVDEITYDSHFKEAARDRSPKAEGRYSAMMSVWSAMAKLQPYSPYGGYISGGYSSAFGSVASSSKPSSKASSPNGGTMVGPNGFADLSDYYDDLETQTDNAPVRAGMGPRTGFVPGDTVLGYFSGEGTILEVIAPRRNGDADTVLVEIPAVEGKQTSRTGTFRSNYLRPAFSREDYLSSFKKVIEDEDGTFETPTMRSLDEVFHFLSTKKNVNDPDQKFDEVGEEYILRVAELVEEGRDLDSILLNEVYVDLMWEKGSEKERALYADMGFEVPQKYVAEVANSVIEAEVATDES